MDYYMTFWYGKMRSYLQPWISTRFTAKEVADNVFLGDIASAYNRKALKKLGITHLLCTVLGIEPVYPKDFVYMNVHLRDVKGETILSSLNKCTQFIEDAVSKDGKVLVHCMCGISRSSSMVIAYLINKRAQTYESAIKQITERRPIVNPNPSFQQQLVNYEEMTRTILLDDVNRTRIVKLRRSHSALF